MRCKARLGLVVTPLGIMTVGSGLEGFIADVLVYRMPVILGDDLEPSWIPAIPGSTFKGVLRSSASKVAKLLNMEGCGYVRPRLTPTCELGYACGKCSVCKLFGAPGRTRSPLNVTPLTPVGDLKEAHERFSSSRLLPSPDEAYIVQEFITLFASVRLRDDRQVAARGALYTCEKIPPGVPFYGELRVEEVRAELYRLLLASLVNLRFEPIGRRSLVKVKVIDQEGLPLDDPMCKLLYEALKEV